VGPVITKFACEINVWLHGSKIVILRAKRGTFIGGALVRNER
jgi:hypothetical protein